jgi:hypothetical protein
MARDAIARLYDVEKNRVTLNPSPEDKGRYQHGLIHFVAKEGKSIDLNQIHESITATRLSGGTNMSVDYLEITARGAVTAGDKQLLLKVSGTGQEFVLGEDASAKGALQRLRQALSRGEKVTTITGRVQGWNGRFPVVLKAMGNAQGSNGRMHLAVTAFAVGKK